MPNTFLMFWLVLTYLWLFDFWACCGYFFRRYLLMRFILLLFFFYFLFCVLITTWLIGIYFTCFFNFWWWLFIDLNDSAHNSLIYQYPDSNLFLGHFLTKWKVINKLQVFKTQFFYNVVSFYLAIHEIFLLSECFRNNNPNFFF